CDPESDSDSIVGQHDSVRTGWLDAAKHAARLDWVVPVLCAAIEICGISAVDDNASQPLLIDTSNLHRRRVWEAWKAVGVRCARWSGLAGLAARIRAAISRAIAHRNRLYAASFRWAARTAAVCIA